MNQNIFFKKKNIKANKLFLKNLVKKSFIINDVKPLHLAKKNDLTFLDSIKYKFDAISTNAGLCITNNTLEKFLPKMVWKGRIWNLTYPLFDIDIYTLQPV